MKVATNIGTSELVWMLTAIIDSRWNLLCIGASLYGMRKKDGTL